jgi:multicomponent Na+:H+ antiporter subunit F
VTALHVATGAVLALAALLVTVRIVVGPTMLDRAISFDVVVAITIGAISLDAVVRRTSENLPLVLVATLLGFVGSVSIARFSPGSDAVEESDDDDGAEGDERRPGEAR